MKKIKLPKIKLFLKSLFTPDGLGKLWSTVLVIFAIALLGCLLYNGWQTYKLLDESVSPTEAVDVESVTINRKTLNETLNRYEKRMNEFQARRVSPPRLPDPS